MGNYKAPKLRLKRAKSSDAKVKGAMSEDTILEDGKGYPKRAKINIKLKRKKSSEGKTTYRKSGLSGSPNLMDERAYTKEQGKIGLERLRMKKEKKGMGDLMKRLNKMK